MSSSPTAAGREVPGTPTNPHFTRSTTLSGGSAGSSSSATPSSAPRGRAAPHSSSSSSSSKKAKTVTGANPNLSSTQVGVFLLGERVSSTGRFAPASILGVREGSYKTVGFKPSGIVESNAMYTGEMQYSDAYDTMFVHRSQRIDYPGFQPGLLPYKVALTLQHQHYMPLVPYVSILAIITCVGELEHLTSHRDGREDVFDTRTICVDVQAEDTDKPEKPRTWCSLTVKLWRHEALKELSVGDVVFYNALHVHEYEGCLSLQTASYTSSLVNPAMLADAVGAMKVAHAARAADAQYSLPLPAGASIFVQ